jgi:hypothetical protein
VIYGIAWDCIYLMIIYTYRQRACALTLTIAPLFLAVQSGAYKPRDGMSQDRARASRNVSNLFLI